MLIFLSRSQAQFIAIVMLFLALATTNSCQSAEPPSTLKNGDFESGLSAWTAEGAATISELAPLQGQKSLKIGPTPGAVRQRYTVGGLQIVYCGVRVQADAPQSQGALRVQCYDTQNHLLMEQRQAVNDHKAVGQAETIGVYFKTHAFTAYLMVSIEKDSATGLLSADSAVLQDYDRQRQTHRPLDNTRLALQPLWQGQRIYNETVLLVSKAGQPAEGPLLYQPTRILSVRDYGLKTTFKPGRDYILDGKTMRCTVRSRLPQVQATSFEQSELKWYELDGKQIVVSYEHNGTWNGPTPRYAGAQLPHTLDKLRRRLPLTIVAHGDSITLGHNSSGYMGLPPYTPTWAELLVDGLKRRYRSPQIRLFNTALGGMTSLWAQETALGQVATLDPDLVIIAFGMNDFWWVPGEDFRKNIQTTMDKVRARRPNAEFLLIASMQFDPAYTREKLYLDNMTAYRTALFALEGRGVQVLDMNAISGALFTAKSPKDMLSNPMHPNDYLARWYAQGLLAMLNEPNAKKQ